MFGKSPLLAVFVVVVAFAYYKTVYKPVYGPVISTTYGQIRGVLATSRDGLPFYKYLGIPYAKPPMGNLRFEIPQPPEPWTSVLDADQFGNQCAQTDLILAMQVGYEDCLFLNVFTPKTQTGGKQFPVLFYIHGGLFTSGSSNDFGPEYFMDEDVVLVTINYRLGSLGFLNTGDGQIRGNMGLKDQALALRWVQQNIAHFGGNPHSVTIFGDSAGAGSVHYHFLAPVSNSLFHKGVSFSGTAINRWALRTEHKEQAERFAKQVNCWSDVPEEIVGCLKNAPVGELLNVQSEITSLFREAIMLYAPTLELVHNDSDTFLTRRAFDIIESGGMQRKPWMVGYNSHEGLFMTAALMTNESLIPVMDKGFTNGAVANNLFIHHVPPQFMGPVKEFYFGRNVAFTSTAQFENYTNMATDLTFAHASQVAIEMQSRYSPVYPFFYTYRGTGSLMDFMLTLKGSLPPLVDLILYFLKEFVNKQILGIKSTTPKEPCHADDQFLLFAQVFSIEPGDQDYKFSKEMVRLLVDFANDDTTLEFQGKKWLPYSPKNKKYFKLDTQSEIIDIPFEERFKFLDTLKYIT